MRHLKWIIGLVICSGIVHCIIQLIFFKEIMLERLLGASMGWVIGSCFWYWLFFKKDVDARYYANQQKKPFRVTEK